MQQLNWSDVLLALSYEAETGLLTWKVNRGKARIGMAAGSLDKDGYIQVVVFRRPVKAHRLAWFIHYGRWPDGEIDHINGLRNDNRIENLRVVSRLKNCHNLHKLPPNETGSKGVARQSTGKFGAKVKFAGKSFWLGTFCTVEEASAAYVAGRACQTREELIAIRDDYRALLRAVGATK